MTIFVYRARPVRDELVQDLDLRTSVPFPDIEGPVAAKAAHDTDAKFIVSALLASLPGGTVDAVLRLLLEHRASLLRVRWPEVDRG